MKKNIIIVALILCCPLLLYVIFDKIIGGLYYEYFTLQGVTGQELIRESVSPDNEYVIRAYRNSGGATTPWAVLCTLTDNKTGKTKNIYWQNRQESAIIEWIDNDTVSINYVLLDLPDDTYDYRYNK